MNFGFTDDQETIKRTAHEFLAARYKLAEVRRLALDDARGFTGEQWDELAGLGWPGIFVEERFGGQGLGIVELAILQEELGYALAPTPFFSDVCAGLVLQASGDDAQRERWLSPLAAGEQRGTLAVVDAGDPIAVDGGSLSGAKHLVAEAASADFIVVLAGETAYVVDAGADGVAIEAQESLDPTRRLFAVSLDGAVAERLAGDGEALARARQALQVALASESVGVAQRAMEMAVEYAKDRKQFDTPIGTFQAVSHRCAQMLLEVEGARSVTLYAAWTLDHEPQSAPLAASMAKAYASDAGWRVTASALQVHGGIGFTWEHDLHFFLKRAKANAHAFGDSREHRRHVAELVGI